MTESEHLLACLIEECAEIQQVATKALRFGLDNHHPDDETTNAQCLAREYTDLMAIIEMLERRKEIDAYPVLYHMHEKIKKTEAYMEYAKSIGTIIESPL